MELAINNLAVLNQIEFFSRLGEDTKAPRFFDNLGGGLLLV